MKQFPPDPQDEGAAQIIKKIGRVSILFSIIICALIGAPARAGEGNGTQDPNPCLIGEACDITLTRWNASIAAFKLGRNAAGDDTSSPYFAPTDCTPVTGETATWEVTPAAAGEPAISYNAYWDGACSSRYGTDSDTFYFIESTTTEEQATTQDVVDAINNFGNLYALGSLVTIALLAVLVMAKLWK